MHVGQTLPVPLYLSSSTTQGKRDGKVPMQVAKGISDQEVFDQEVFKPLLVDFLDYC